MTENTVTFTLTPSDAEAVAYMILDEGAEQLSAEDILAGGTTAETSESTYTVENLTAATSYTIVAAARNGEVYSTVASASFTTIEPEVIVPTLTLESVAATRTTVSFVYSCENATKVAYQLLESDAGIPQADRLLEEGVQVDMSSNEVVIEGCEVYHSYMLVAASMNDEGYYSEVAYANIRTLQEDRLDEDIATSIEAAEVEIVGEQGDYNKLLATFEDAEGREVYISFYANISGTSIENGTYSVTGNTNVGSIESGDIDPEMDWFYGSYIHYRDDMYDHYYAAISGGSMTIEENRVTFDLVFNNYFSYTATFEGALEVIRTSQIGSTLTQDYTGLTFDSSNLDWSWHGYYNRGDYAQLNIVQADGNALYIYFNQGGDEIPTGIFTEGTEGMTFRPGKASAGYIDSSVGTGLEIRPEGFKFGGNGYTLAPADHGTITIKDNGDGTYTVEFDLYDDLDFNFSGSYVGEI